MSFVISTLNDLTDVITKGTTPTTLGLKFTEGGIPFIRVENLRDGSIHLDFDAQFISQETHQALARSKILPNDVLVSIAGTIGRAAIAPSNLGEMNCNQAVAIIRPGPALNRRYLLHWMMSPEALGQIRKSQVTATISNLSLSQIANLKISVPPLDEQLRIAKILDAAEAPRSPRQARLPRAVNLYRDFWGPRY